MTNGDVIQNGNMFEDDISKGFFSDVLHHVCNLSVSPTSQKSSDQSIYLTSRDVFHGTREDLSTESGVVMSDDSALFVEARPSPMDINKQKEVVDVLTRFLQVCFVTDVTLYAQCYLKEKIPELLTLMWVSDCVMDFSFLIPLRFPV